MTALRPRAAAATAVIASLLTLMAACGTETGAGGSSPRADRACRAELVEVFQTQGENGSYAPAGSAVRNRWHDEDHALKRLTGSAKGEDCPGAPKRYRQRFAALDRLMGTATDVDMRDRLHYAEIDLRHAVDTRDYHPLPRRLAAAFRVLRHRAPAAHEAVRVSMDQAGKVDLEDGDAVTAAVRSMKRAAADSADVAACRRALGVISGYELDEE